MGLLDILFGDLLGDADKVAARFTNMRGVTAAVDWFRNQGIAPDHIKIWTATPERKLRAPQPGDNRRTGLEWIVVLDAKAAGFGRDEAAAALVREGGALYRFTPKGL